MTTPRAISLVRADSLPSAQRAIAALVERHPAAAARACAVIVPTRAAGLCLRETLENLRFASAPGPGDAALVLPELLTRDDWYRRMHEQAGCAEPRLSAIERVVLLGAAARDAIEAGAVPPFRLRPGLVAEILAFYDELCRGQRTIEAFERLVTGDLEPRADMDRGAERLLRQTRFLGATLRAFEQRVAASGKLDEHQLRRRLLEPPGAATFAHVVVAVGDRVTETSGGMYPADFDLLARLPHVETIAVVATRAQLAAGLHERLRDLIPGLDERDAVPAGYSTRLAARGDEPGRLYATSRDREEELRGIARRIKRDVRRAGPTVAPGRVAVVFQRPLPYVYLGRNVFEAAGIACQTADALPLAAEPFAAALDVVFAVVESRFARSAVVAMLRSPHLAPASAGERPTAEEVTAFDRHLAEAVRPGGAEALARLAETWSGPGARAARAAWRQAQALTPLSSRARVSEHVAVLIDVLRAADRPGAGDEAVESRHLRARGAVLGALEALRAAALRYDDPVVPFAEVASTIRRWMESQTFSPRRGATGVQFVDAQAARYGDFDAVHLVGLVDGEWPGPSGRNIFYPAFLLSQLGWPAESARLAGARAGFIDLLRLARERVHVSTFTLEEDSIVNPSPLVGELERAGLEVERTDDPVDLVFVDEALAAGPAVLGPGDAAGLPACLQGDARAWTGLRLLRSPAAAPEFHGRAGPGRRPVVTVTAVDRYLDCPFKYFAATILQLPEDVPDEMSMAATARGRFVHEVLRAFFEEWQAAGGGGVTPSSLVEARAVFTRVAERQLAALPARDAVVERMRLLGSAATPGIGETVLAAEIARPAPVRERLLEYALDGEFEFSAAGATRAVRLRGQVDRIDLLSDGRFRLIDYKTGKAPDVRRAVQLPIYAICAGQQLQRTRGERWEVAEASYLAFGERTPLRAVIGAGAGAAETLAAAEARLLGAIDRIDRGEFPPQPAHRWLCATCAYAGVCRKDYVAAD